MTSEVFATPEDLDSRSISAVERSSGRRAIQGCVPYSAAGNSASNMAAVRRPYLTLVCRDRAILAEAVPAGQLCTWVLPVVGYGKSEQRGTRLRIVEALRDRRKLTLKQDHMDVMLACPDALDAVFCIFAAKAALNCRRQSPEHHDRFKEGSSRLSSDSARCASRPMLELINSYMFR